MKLAAVFITWADGCLLPYAIENIRPVVDEIIVIWSRKSNRGNIVEYELPKDCILIQCEPKHAIPNHNELDKRNAGLEAAKEHGFTHFLMADSDEFYLQSEFTAQKKHIEEKNIIGTVCRIKTYFKSPTLTIGLDTNTIVPFIHRLSPRLHYLLNYAHYPFAYKNGSAQIDCTRRLNISTGVTFSHIVMHHMSYIRKDMALKLENSSANFKNGRSELVYEDLKNAKEGYFLKGYQKILVNSPNIFNLPEYD